MSPPPPPKAIGAVLVGVALAGAVGMALFPSMVPRQATALPPDGGDTQWTAPRLPAREASSLTSDSAAPPSPPKREIVASPLDSAATDSARGSCVMRVKQLLSEAAQDSSEVTETAVMGVRPEAGRGPDSLVVEGTAHGHDATPAVWHCAIVSNGAGKIGKLTAVVEDGWPGVSSAFDAAHAVTMTAKDACLQQTKSVYPEYDFRGVHAFRDVDTLHVRGDAFPFNDGDRVGHFHCRAVVRGGRVVRTRATAER